MKKELLKGLLVGFALWAVLSFGKHLGRNRNDLPKTLWNHGCSNSTSDFYTGTNWLVWHCACGKSGTNAFPVESSAELKPWFTNVPPRTFQCDYRTNYNAKPMSDYPKHLESVCYVVEWSVKPNNWSRFDKVFLSQGGAESFSETQWDKMKTRVIKIESKITESEL